MRSAPVRLIVVRRNDRFGFPDGTGAAPITGAPAAHCFCIHRTLHRGVYGLATRYVMGTIRFS
ncbi:MAG: hypothetical protein ABSG41_26125, partial [Bryobacteraceae bacterium]